VPDLAFYNAGCEHTSGLRTIVVLMRRLLRRVLRPIFMHQVVLYQHLIERLDRTEASLRGVQGDIEAMGERHVELDERVESVQAFGWDYVALVRRLAVLEDQIAALTGQSLPQVPVEETEAQTSIRFPSLDVGPTEEARAKVS
jgi:hypothetical protein